MPVTVPPPPATRHAALCDTELFPNYWLWKLRPLGRPTHTVRLYSGQRLTPAQAALIRACHDAFTTITFNGLGYDVLIIRAALAGWTVEELKQLNDCIIRPKIHPDLTAEQWDFLRSKGFLGQPFTGSIRAWHCDSFLPAWEPADHIDVMNTAPGKGSLKVYAARIHSKTIRDLPYSPDHVLAAHEFQVVEDYCETDLDDLGDLYRELTPQLKMRELYGKIDGLDLRSKSDPQMAEAVLKKRCEDILGHRLFKQDIDWNMRFKYNVPPFIAYSTPQMQHVLTLVSESIFRLGMTGHVVEPPQLRDLQVTLGGTTYTMGIGGLHSNEKSLSIRSDATRVILCPDVRGYYPRLIINSGEYPPSLGPVFCKVYPAIVDDRDTAKGIYKRFVKQGITSGAELDEVEARMEGGKVMSNGTFGNTSSMFSILFGPPLMIQTTLNGQLSILMLIEWLEHNGCPVVSANTDGIVIYCERHKQETAAWLIAEWEKRTGLTMESETLLALHARDVNSYFAIKAPDDVKRKGPYAPASLIYKKSPDVEICSDAVEAWIARGVPIEYTIAACLDIRKFVTVQTVNCAGGGVKLWGHGPLKTPRLKLDMMPVLEANGWAPVKGRRGFWVCTIPGAALEACELPALQAYQQCFTVQRREPMGKVCRWYYGTRSPGPIVYATNGNTVSLSYGATPCQTLPDVFPDDIDYEWYVRYAREILVDIGINN